MLTLLRKLFCSFQFFASHRKLAPQEEYENLVIPGVRYFRQTTPWRELWPRVSCGKCRRKLGRVLRNEVDKKKKTTTIVELVG